jgi:hypothetical protein
MLAVFMLAWPTASLIMATRALLTGGVHVVVAGRRWAGWVMW